ncbi:MAG TPA: hypothetical protein VFK73_08995, partial [Paludibacter sp.]|nr:hypothetical protein [Paludibacter sp.]
MNKNQSLNLLAISLLFAGHLLATEPVKKFETGYNGYTNNTSSPSSVRQKNNSTNYLPFLNNSKWFVVWSTWEGYQSRYVFCNGDSVVNGNTYQKVYLKFIKIPNHWVYPYVEYDHEFIYTLLREDVENRKVYRMSSANQESLLYDFSLNIGDTLPSNTTYTLSGIDSIDTSSGKHKRFTFSSSNDKLIYWYEGIGNPANPFSNYSTLSSSSSYTQLYCMYQNDSTIYENCRLVDVNCADYVRLQTALPEVGDAPELIYPNPTSGKVRIVTGSMPVHSVSISDALGRVVQVVSGSNESPVTEFSLLGYE